MNRSQSAASGHLDGERGAVSEVDVFVPEIQGQQTELVYNQAPAALGAAFAVSVLITLGLWDVVNHAHLLLWIAAQVIQTGLRLGMVYRYRHAPARQRQNARWTALFFTGTLVSGIIWGCLGLFFDFSLPIEYQSLFIMGMAGVLAGAISSYGAILPIYAAFMVPAILIPAQVMLQHNSDVHSNMGLLFIVFAAVLLTIARNYNKSVLRTLQLRHENRGLLRDMSTANETLEAEVAIRQAAENELLRERRLFIEGPVTVFRWRADTGWPIEYVSDNVSQYGYTAGSLIQDHVLFSRLIHPSDLRRVEEAEGQSGEHGELFYGIDYRIVCADGRERWVYDYTVPLRDAAGKVSHFAGYLLDITDRKEAEAELMQAKDYAQVTLHSIADAVITTDVNGQIEYLNPKAEQMTGWDSEISRGLPISRVFSLVGKDSCDSAEGALRHCLSTGMSIISSRDDTLRRHDGTLFSVRYSASPILANSGIPLGMILIFSDVTETRSMERKLTYQATHDALTGLINRTEFELRLTEAIESAQRQDEHHVLCYMDLDKLKLINDTCSHESGDKLIVQVTAILQGCIRDSDILARLGGDEYGLLIRNCSLHDAERLVEKMLTEIHAHRFATRGHTFEVSASIGVAPVDSGCENANQVMSAADLACYASKDAGGNRYHVYQVSDRQLVQRHDEMRWVSKLTEAIESDRLVLYYQDIVPVVSDDAAPHHFEILVRMLDEQGGIVPPGRFLPAAERYGLATSLDRWVVSHSFSWYAEHIGSQAEPGALCMSLNLSGASITDKRFLKFIIAGMRYHDIPPQAICFEITETAAIANLESAIEFILELRSLGCSFALDDFGSGLSSFAYLKHLPVDYLKIDGSFVKDMETDALDCAMVSSIHQIGSVIGIKTIAEFVENEQILKKLADIGVDYAQGYGIAKPAPLDDLTAASRQSA